MELLKGFLVVLEVITSALLICVILVQKTKGGMGSAMGGMGEQVFGSRMGNVLTKATVWLVAVFLINTIVIARMGSAPVAESVVDSNPIEQTAPIGNAASMQPAPGGLPEAPLAGAPDMGSMDISGDVPAVPALDGPVDSASAVPAVDVDAELPVVDTPAAPATE